MRAVGHGLLSGCFLGRFLLLLLKALHLLFGPFLALLLRQVGDGEQGVLLLHVACIDGELVEHIGAELYLAVAGIGLGQLGDGLGIAGLRLGVFTLVEIYRAQREVGHGFVHSVAGGFLHGEDVVGRCVGCVFAR